MAHQFWHKPDIGAVALLISLGCPESDIDEVFQRMALVPLPDTSAEMLAFTRKTMCDVAREREEGRS